MQRLGPWDFDASEVRCSVVWWHGDADTNLPISAVRRLAARVPAVDLRTWSNAGHFESYFRHDEILDELLAR